MVNERQAKAELLRVIDRVAGLMPSEFDGAVEGAIVEPLASIVTRFRGLLTEDERTMLVSIAVSARIASARRSGGGK